MLTPRIVARALLPGLMAFGVGVASSQNYPNKPIRIFANEAGGPTDFIARLIAQGLTANLGQPVIVENRGGGIIAADAAAKATPDGYTLLYGPSTFWTQPLLQKTPYDPVRDFSPISLVMISPNVLTVHPSVPTTSVRELIALAKARPGQLNYGSGGTGAPNHIAGELFNTMAGVNIVRVAYRSGGSAVNAVLVGDIHLSFPSAIGAAPFVKSRRLRALAVTTAQPSALAPGLPTIAASGLPGFEVDITSGVLAPVRTPETVIKRLNQEIVRFLNTPDVKERLLSAGAEASPSSSEEFAVKMKAEMSRLGKLFKDVGIRAE